MKKLLMIVMLVVLVAGCKGSQSKPISSEYNKELWQSVPGSTHGGETYDSDKIHDPANKKGLYIW